jgi:predicted enzyme related to lactoylglutathione lyase
VPDVDALVARIRAAGHPVLVEPHDIEAMGMKIRLAFVQDPNGARVELIGILDPPSRATRG